MNRLFFVSAASVLLLAPNGPDIASAAEPGTIETIAGTGQSQNSGNAGAALETNVGNPFGVELGPDGALYICEVTNHRVLRLDLKTAQLTTVAGTGRAGHSGDGGPATAAELNEPYEVRFDDAGNMYFVEMKNHIVRRVDAQTKIITTIAGTGKPGYSGDGGPAEKATFKQPHSIALDGNGSLYIADIGNHRIRRVDLAQGTVETIAGTGGRKLPKDGSPIRNKPILGPRALTIANGKLWIALREGHSIWRLDLDTGIVHHIAGTGQRGYADGPNQKSTFNGPKGIAVGPNANIYVVDTENQTIRKIDLNSGLTTTVAGTGPTARGPKGDGGSATDAQLNRPHGICIAPDGTIYIGDSENHRVRRVRFNAPAD